jgi:hypothetical protein
VSRPSKAIWNAFNGAFVRREALLFEWRCEAATAGAQAQVDWGDEGPILAHVGIAKVYSFHMVLSYSRDPFCCFTTSRDLSAFWECHRRAFAHFAGVPKSIGFPLIWPSRQTRHVLAAISSNSAGCWPV